MVAYGCLCTELSFWILLCPCRMPFSQKSLSALKIALQNECHGVWIRVSRDKVRDSWKRNQTNNFFFSLRFQLYTVGFGSMKGDPTFKRFMLCWKLQTPELGQWRSTAAHWTGLPPLPNRGTRVSGSSNAGEAGDSLDAYLQHLGPW